MNFLEFLPGIAVAGSDYSGISISLWSVFAGFPVADFAEAAAGFATRRVSISELSGAGMAV